MRKVTVSRPQGLSLFRKAGKDTDVNWSTAPAIEGSVVRTGLVPSARRALILDDSEVDRKRITRLSKQADLDLDFVEAATIAEFAAHLDGPLLDIVFLDYQLVQGDGLIALDMLRRHPIQKKAAAIMVAGEGQIQVAVDAIKNGCSDYIVKSNLSPDMMVRAVSNALEKSTLRSALRDEEDLRAAMQRSLSRFALSCGSEMRSILSAMLRQSRTMRRQVASGGVLLPDDFAGIEHSCQRLWDFLEEFHDFVSDAAENKGPPPH